jgi:hypothetical protein
MNGVVNPLVARILRSRAHRMLSGRLALLEITGRTSGREFAVPVLYRRVGAHHLRVEVGAPGSKLWWRSFRSPWPLRAWVGGRPWSGTGVALQEGSKVSVLIEDVDP